MQKFKTMNLHKRRKTLEEIAKEINPVLCGIINYYHKFWDGDMRIVWNQLNARLLKMGKMGEGFVQNGICKIPENKIQGETQFIRTLVIGISMKLINFNVV